MKRWSLALALVVAMLASIPFVLAFLHRSEARSADELLLVVADNTRADDPYVTAWLDAASEEGLHLSMTTASEFVRPQLFTRVHARGIILPDSVHRSASDPFIEVLAAQVAQGTHLMVVFDAATLDMSGAYAAGKSRLSGMVGVDYALYDLLKNETMRPTTVLGSATVMDDLRLPPGRYASSADKPGPLPLTAALNQAPNGEQTITSYEYAISSYAHFVTADVTASTAPLLHGENGQLVAGRTRYGQGEVLFVNLPLGYLKLRSDGMFLHAFLHYFAVDMLALPYLAASPDGIGGIVMNWHVDSNASLPALGKLAATGIFKQGPYSVHFTTGPDTYRPGDGSGLNARNNPEAQRWIRFFADRGDAIGSHGGWIHNYFGLNVTEKNEQEFEPYLVKNKDDLEAITNSPVTEYSAPVGNHPLWTTNWLAQHGVNSYYFTGNIGMGPTRSYRNGVRSDVTTWSFPVVTYGKAASFEEAHAAGISGDEIGSWLIALDDFCADNHVVRLVYFHPEGVLYYEDATRRWLAHSQQLRDSRKMRWYTMTDAADFMSRRSELHWRLEATPGGLQVFSAEHPVSLAHAAWVFAKARYERPVMREGVAAVHESATEWLLVAGEGKRLSGSVQAKNTA